MPKCFFAHLGGCEGALVRAHLVPKSRLKVERRSSISLWDQRVWRWMCGGSTGIGGHHGAYDAKQITLDAWPEDFLGFLREYDLEWMAEAYAR